MIAKHIFLTFLASCRLLIYFTFRKFMLFFQINKKAGVSNVERLADCISTTLLYTPAKGATSMVQNEMLKANRMYKDTVFRMLFSDRKNLLSLYNAISGSHYDDPDKLEIVTLEMTWLLSLILIYFYMNISLLTIQICRCVIYSIFPVNTRN